MFEGQPGRAVVKDRRLVLARVGRKAAAKVRMGLRDG
jgi:hypothetical protein